jgi:hypothetical protein
LVGFSKFVRIFVQMLILGAGAYLVINGRLTSGGMIAASILLGRALAPVEQAIGAWKGIVSARDAYDRLKRLLERLPPGQEVMPLPAPKGRLTCEQVIYVPRGRDKPVLNGVSFALQPGEALGRPVRLAIGTARAVRRLPAAGHRTVRRHGEGQHRPARPGRRCRRGRRGRDDGGRARNHSALTERLRDRDRRQWLIPVRRPASAPRPGTRAVP